MIKNREKYNLKTMFKWFKYLFRRIKREKIKAVYDDDLESLLKSLNILEKVNDGEYKCTICDCTITLLNIGIIKKEKGDIIILCNKVNCICT